MLFEESVALWCFWKNIWMSWAPKSENRLWRFLSAYWRMKPVKRQYLISSGETLNYSHLIKRDKKVVERRLELFVCNLSYHNILRDRFFREIANNGMSTFLGLFHADSLGNYVHLCFLWNRFVWVKDGTLTGITLGQGEPGSNDNEGGTTLLRAPELKIQFSVIPRMPVVLFKGREN